jgi:hypothetical protein
VSKGAVHGCGLRMEPLELPVQPTLAQQYR